MCSMNKTHARQVHAAPTQHPASLLVLRAEAKPGHNAGWKAPIKIPNAQVKGRLLEMTNTSQSRMPCLAVAKKEKDLLKEAENGCFCHVIRRVRVFGVFRVVENAPLRHALRARGRIKYVSYVHIFRVQNEK